MANEPEFEIQELLNAEKDAKAKGETRRLKAIQQLILTHPDNEPAQPPSKEALAVKGNPPPTAGERIVSGLGEVKDDAYDALKQFGYGLGEGGMQIADGLAYLGGNLNAGATAKANALAGTDAEQQPVGDYGGISRAVKGTDAFQNIVGDDFPEARGLSRYARTLGNFTAGVPFGGVGGRTLAGVGANYAKNIAAPAVATQGAIDAGAGAVGSTGAGILTGVMANAIGRGRPTVFPVGGNTETIKKAERLAAAGNPPHTSQAVDSNLLKVLQGTTDGATNRQKQDFTKNIAMQTGLDSPSATATSGALAKSERDIISSIDSHFYDDGEAIVAKLTPDVMADLKSLEQGFQSKTATSKLPSVVEPYLVELNRIMTQTKDGSELTLSRLNDWRIRVGKKISSAGDDADRDYLVGFRDLIDRITGKTIGKSGARSLAQDRKKYQNFLVVQKAQVASNNDVLDPNKLGTPLQSTFGLGNVAKSKMTRFGNLANDARGVFKPAPMHDLFSSPTARRLAVGGGVAALSDVSGGGAPLNAALAAAGFVGEPVITGLLRSKIADRLLANPLTMLPSGATAAGLTINNQANTSR